MSQHLSIYLLFTSSAIFFLDPKGQRLPVCHNYSSIYNIYEPLVVIGIHFQSE